jgi:hypothetical protein
MDPLCPRVSPTAKAAPNFREPQREQEIKECEPAARLNLLLTLRGLRLGKPLGEVFGNPSSFSAMEGANFLQRFGGDSASP